MELDREGGYYLRHASAMTSEGLHEKCDIAAELGYRDMVIDDLCEALEDVVKNEEQRVFEDWLASNSPSGCVELVEAQWKMSAEYLDFSDEWQSSISALERGRG